MTVLQVLNAYSIFNYIVNVGPMYIYFVIVVILRIIVDLCATPLIWPSVK
jgi:hypothetical protein